MAKTAKARRRKALAATDLHEDAYQRTAPGPVAGHNTRGVFLLVDAEGWAVGMVERELRPGDPPHDVRQTDMLALYADRKARFEAARKTGVAIPLPDDYNATEDPTTTEDSTE